MRGQMRMHIQRGVPMPAAERLVPILYLEINAIGLLILLIVAFSQRRMGLSSARQRSFHSLLWSCGLMLALDTALWLLNGRTFPGARPLLCAVSTAYYAFAPLVAYFWLRYCDLHIYADPQRLRRRRGAYLAPFALNAALCLPSAWTGWVFYVDAANVHHRGRLFAAHALISLACLLYALCLVWRREAGARLTRAERVDMTLFMLPPIAGIVVQWLFYGVTVLWVMAAVAILFVYLNVQNEQIFSDPLTGLNNRRRFVQYLSLRAQTALPEGQRLFALMVDLDRFKHINDTYGHTVGDRALMRMAEALKRACAEHNDFLARIGGDEFVLLCQRESEEEVRETVALLRGHLEALNRLSDDPFNLAFSAGWAEFGHAHTTAEAVLAAADRHMYSVKSAHESARGLSGKRR